VQSEGDDEDERIFSQGQRRAASSPKLKPRQKSAARSSDEQKDPFVKLPLWWANAAAKATKTPRAVVWVALVYTAWRKRSLTFSLPNGQLKKLGVSREVKRRALRDLEKAGLIVVDRRHGKSPQVVIVAL
jgi:hypothetical protein